MGRGVGYRLHRFLEQLPRRVDGVVGLEVALLQQRQWVVHLLPLPPRFHLRMGRTPLLQTRKVGRMKGAVERGALRQIQRLVLLLTQVEYLQPP